MSNFRDKGGLYFIEQRIISAVRGLLTGNFNAYLLQLDFQIPVVEFGIFRGVNVIAPLITLASCEQTEKERIVKQDSKMPDNDELSAMWEDEFGGL